MVRAKSTSSAGTTKVAQTIPRREDRDRRRDGMRATPGAETLFLPALSIRVPVRLLSCGLTPLFLTARCLWPFYGAHQALGTEIPGPGTHQGWTRAVFRPS